MKNTFKELSLGGNDIVLIMSLFDSCLITSYLCVFCEIKTISIIINVIVMTLKSTLFILPLIC